MKRRKTIEELVLAISPILALIFLFLTIGLLLQPNPVPIHTNFFVATHNATEWEKSHANLICDGEDNQEEINRLLGLMPQAGGELMTSSGCFVLSDTMHSFLF